MDEMGWDWEASSLLSLFPPPPLPPSLFPLVPAEKAGSERPFFASKFLCRKFFGEFLLSAGAGPLLLGTLSLEAFPSRSSLPNDVGRRRRPLPPLSSQQLSLFQTAGGGKRGRIERRTLNLNLSLSFLPPPSPSRRRRRDVEERGTFFEWGKSRRGLFA